MRQLDLHMSQLTQQTVVELPPGSGMEASKANLLDLHVSHNTRETDVRPPPVVGMKASKERTLGPPPPVARFQVVCTVRPLHNARPLPVRPHGMFPENQSQVVHEPAQASTRPETQVWKFLFTLRCPAAAAASALGLDSTVINLSMHHHAAPATELQHKSMHKKARGATLQ